MFRRFALAVTNGSAAILLILGLWVREWLGERRDGIAPREARQQSKS